MNTKTKPELGEPEIPLNIALDNEDYTRVDVCVLSSRKYALSSCARERNLESVVGVFIRNSEIDLKNFLDNAEELESRFFEEAQPQELKDKIISNVSRMRPLRDDKVSNENGKYFILEYDPAVKEQVYEIVREL